MTGSTSKLAGTGPFSGRSLSELGRDLRSGRTSALELAEQALEAAHTHGPALNCYTAIDNPGALHGARSADHELAAGRDRGPLHGIPVGVKDIIAVAGLPTAMGSQHFASHTPTADAAVVGSLRRAGAVIIGKTHAHEFAFGPTGDRALTGPARNPHDSGRVTGGSSSGSAAAVAAGLLPVALGTDTAGSIRIPAALCGTVGLRPSSGTVSCEGIFPLSRTLDVVGPLAATAADTAAAWWALSARPDHTGVLQPRWIPAWNEDGPGPSHPRWGLVRGNLADRVTPGVRRTVQNAAAALGSMDITVEEIEIPELDECAEHHNAIQSAEAFALHQHRVARAPELFHPEILAQLQAAATVRGWEYVAAFQAVPRLRSEVLERLAAVDVLIMPVVPIEAPEIDQRELPESTGWSSVRQALKALTAPWSLLDFPALSLPVPADSGLPQAVQLVGKPGQEWQLLQAAHALEAALRPASHAPQAAGSSLR